MSVVSEVDARPAPATSGQGRATSSRTAGLVPLIPAVVAFCLLFLHPLERIHKLVGDIVALFGLSGMESRKPDKKWRIAGPQRPADAVLIVRPEKVKIFDADSLLDGWNATSAVVTDCSHLGAVCRVDLRFPDGSPGSATVPTSVVPPVRPGDSLLAAWEPAAQAFVVARV